MNTFAPANWECWICLIIQIIFHIEGGIHIVKLRVDPSKTNRVHRHNELH